MSDVFVDCAISLSSENSQSHTYTQKQSKVDYKNYMPISLLFNIEKIVEKLMYKRLSNFLDIDNLIYPLQFGFQQKHLTTNPLINLTDSIRQTLDEGSSGCDIFVDWEKAFIPLIIKSYSLVQIKVLWNS